MTDIDIVKKYFNVGDKKAQELIAAKIVDMDFIKNRYSDVIEKDVSVLKDKIDDSFKDIEK